MSARRRSHRLVAGFAVVAALVAASCSGGGSITDSGQSATTTPAVTGGDTTMATTTTVAADTLPDCPTEALDTATETVELTFWHGMSGPLGEELDALAAEYNAGQSKVHVTLVGGNYEETLDKYLQSNQDSRPDIIQLPEYTVQSIIDTGSTVPVGKCIESSGLDTSAFLPTALDAYATQGMQWAMPFNISNPVLFYNKKVFEQAGLDPDTPPLSLDDVRTYSQQIIDSGAASYGIALESGFDSGGGWYIEQWFCKSQEYYVDGDNGRTSRATKVLFDNDTATNLLTFLQQMVTDGIAVNVGDNSGTGYDNLLKLADAQQPAAMTIATSASLGPVLDVLRGDQFPQLTVDDVGVSPMPGPDGAPGALIGGAALWAVNHDDPVRVAATWDFIQFLTGAQQQSAWAAGTGYIPVRSDARDLEPYAGTLAADPRFGVALDQLLASPDALTSSGPVVGPLREIRSVLAIAVAAILGGADVATSLADAASQADGLIADYNARNS